MRQPGFACTEGGCLSAMLARTDERAKRLCDAKNEQRHLEGKQTSHVFFALLIDAPFVASV